MAYQEGKAVLAKTVIHRAVTDGTPGNKLTGVAAVPPKIQEIKAGSRFVPRDQDEYDELLGMEAIGDLPDEEAEVDQENAVERVPRPAKPGKPVKPGKSDKSDTSGLV